MKKKLTKRPRSGRKHKTNGRKLWPNRLHLPYHGCHHLQRNPHRPCRCPTLHLRRLLCLLLQWSRSHHLVLSLHARKSTAVMVSNHRFSMHLLLKSIQIHGSGNLHLTLSSAVSKLQTNLLRQWLALKLKLRPRPL